MIQAKIYHAHPAPFGPLGHQGRQNDLAQVKHKMLREPVVSRYQFKGKGLEFKGVPHHNDLGANIYI